MKSEFILKTFDSTDDWFTRKLEFLSVLEAAFDDYRNQVPESFYFFTEEDRFPLGKSIKLTLEVVEEETK